MIYKVNAYNELPTYFDGANNLNAKIDAENLLAERRAALLISEAVRFSMCATFVSGNDTTWRELKDTDPEDTICQVFDTLTGKYTEVPNKTAAYALNEANKESFLKSVYLDQVYELAEMPVDNVVTDEGQE
jgi:hypothetical protein